MNQTCHRGGVSFRAEHRQPKTDLGRAADIQSLLRSSLRAQPPGFSFARSPLTLPSRSIRLQAAQDDYVKQRSPSYSAWTGITTAVPGTTSLPAASDAAVSGSFQAPANSSSSLSLATTGNLGATGNGYGSVSGPSNGTAVMSTNSYLPLGQDTLEVAATRKTLADALLQIDLLTQQVSIVDELKQCMLEQDQVITQLQQLAEKEKKASDEEREELLAKLVELEAKLMETQQRLAEQADMQGLQERINSLAALVEQQELDSSQLKERLQAAEDLQDELRAAAEKAKADAADAEAKLARKNEELEAIEADIENMRKSMSRGKKAKGFGKSEAEHNLRKKLKQAQEEAEALQSEMEKKDAALQAAQSAVDFLTNQCKDQEAHVQQLQERVHTLQEQLKGSAAGAALQALENEFQSAQARLKAEMADKAEKEAKAAALQQELAVKTKALEEDKQQMKAEVDRLLALIQEYEDSSRLQEVAISDLDQSMKELRAEVESAQQLKVEISILADAFQEKETEVATLTAQLTSLSDSNQKLQAELEVARTTSEKLSATSKELKKTNDELTRRLEQIEANFRSKDRNARSAEGKVNDIEQQLVSASQQIMALKTELGNRSKEMMQVKEQLRTAQDAESSQRSAAEALSRQLANEQALGLQQGQELQQLRMQANTLTDQLQAMSAVLDKSKATLDARESELAELRNALEMAKHDNTDLMATLERSVKDFGVARKNEELQAASLRFAEDANAKLSKELERLKAEMAARDQKLAGIQQTVSSGQWQASQEATQRIQTLTAAVQEREGLLQAAIRARDAADADLRNSQAAMAELSEELEALKEQTEQLSEQLAAAQQPDDKELNMNVLLEFQRQLGQETLSTMELLAKAENYVRTATGREAPQAVQPPTTQRTADTESLVTEVRRLRVELADRSGAADEAAQRAAALERDIVLLQDELTSLRRMVAQQNLMRGSSAQQVAASSSKNVAEMVAELATARDDMLATRAVADALKSRVQFLERELANRDQQMEDMSGALTKGAKNKQFEDMARQLALVTEENTRLKAAQARQQQLLDQAKKFLQLKSVVPLKKEPAQQDIQQEPATTNGSKPKMALW